MSKKCMVYRNKSKQKKSDLYYQRRLELKLLIKKAKKDNNLELIFQLYQKLSLLPRSSSKTRYNNICFITGRSRSVYRRFGISRIKLREMASYAQIPGIRKSSW